MHEEEESKEKFDHDLSKKRTKSEPALIPVTDIIKAARIEIQKQQVLYLDDAMGGMIDYAASKPK